MVHSHTITESLSVIKLLDELGSCSCSILDLNSRDSIKYDKKGGNHGYY